MAVVSGGNVDFNPWEIRYAAAAISGPTTVSPNLDLISLEAKKDVYFGGTDYVAGQVVINGTGKLAYVRVYEQKSGLFVAGGWTDASGNFSFPNLRSDLSYNVIAFDFVGGEQAYVYDRV